MSIIRVSFLSLESKSFRTRHRLPAARRNHQLPAIQVLAEPEGVGSNSSYSSCLIEIERESPEIEDVDDRASEYIRGFHAKNRHASRIVSKQSSDISPPFYNQ